jgi:hypothetical protein
MRNWKTSLTGFFLAILLAIQPLAETGTFDLKRDWMRYLIAIGIATFGFLSKDHDVTGTA